MAKLHRTAKSVAGVYRGYIPPDLPQHRPPNRIKPWWKVQGKPKVTIYPKEQIEGYTDEPEYPPLGVVDFEGRKGVRWQNRLDWYDSLKRIPSNVEKLLEIGKHAQHYIAHINNWMTNYDSLPMVQYLTQTKLIDPLPDNYRTLASKNIEVDANDGVDNSNKKLLDQVRQIILDQIALDKYESEKKSPGFVSISARDGNRTSYVSNNFVQNIVSGLRKCLSLEVNSQLLDYQYDLNPSIRSWWFHSGFKPPNNKVYYKARKDKDGNINQMIQMNGSAALNIRGTGLIEPILSQADPLVTDTSLVKKFNHPLKFYDAIFKFKWPVALPGFWFEDEPKFDFPHTCFLSTDCLQLRHKKNFKNVKPLDDDENCLNSQAILTAFGWLNSLSMYHGFTPYQELEYPLTCQVVTTDGQNWVFNVYQLNSHAFHRDLGGPKKNNICWTSGKMKLFEDYVDGDFMGVNDDVVRLIVRFLAQKFSSEYTSQLNLRTFLGADDKSQEEKNKIKADLRKLYEGRCSKYRSSQWFVPLYEHIFFRSPEGRNRITFMKAKYHMPKPKMPKMFE